MPTIPSPIPLPSLVTDRPPSQYNDYSDAELAVVSTTLGNQLLMLSYTRNGDYQSFKLTLKEAEHHANNILIMVESLRAVIERKRQADEERK